MLARTDVWRIRIDLPVALEPLTIMDRINYAVEQGMGDREHLLRAILHLSPDDRRILDGLLLGPPPKTLATRHVLGVPTDLGYLRVQGDAQSFLELRLGPHS